jgi:hypothetical protein
MCEFIATKKLKREYMGSLHQEKISELDVKQWKEIEKNIEHVKFVIARCWSLVNSYETAIDKANRVAIGWQLVSVMDALRASPAVLSMW